MTRLTGHAARSCRADLPRRSQTKAGGGQRRTTLPPTLHASPSEHGIALIIVLISIFVLSMLAGGFAIAMKTETKLARNANSETELEWLGRSGVQYARWILAQQLNIREENYDALNQVWAGGAGGFATSNSPLADVQREVHLGNGSFTWKITDLERKFNINLALNHEEVLRQACQVVGVDAGEADTIVGSIIDWIDKDNDTHIAGAETDYYQTLNPPYEAKNGFIDDLSELLLIRGITPEMYWGSSSTNHPSSAFQQRLNPFGDQLAPPSYPSGFVDLFTAISGGTRDGKMLNVNTASAEVLQLILGGDARLAQAIVAGRQGEDDGSGDFGPYKNLQDLIRKVPEIPRTGPVFEAFNATFSRYAGFSSRTFEVQIDAQISGYRRQFIAILGRNNQRDIQILNFYWK